MALLDGLKCICHMKSGLSTSKAFVSSGDCLTVCSLGLVDFQAQLGRGRGRWASPRETTCALDFHAQLCGGERCSIFGLKWPQLNGSSDNPRDFKALILRP